MKGLARALTIATYNVHRCIGGDGRYDAERTLSVVRELDSDVLALQELHWRPDEALHLLNDFASRLSYVAVAGPTLLDPTGHYGNALLTRLAIVSVNHIDLSVAEREPRGALDVILESGQAVIRVVATHLGLLPSERRTQIRQLLACMEERQTVTTVLMGDLNEWFLWGQPLRWLYSFFKATPAPATFPSNFPLFALDRIWVKPRQRLRELTVHDTPLARKASDHLPLRVVIDLGGEAIKPGFAFQDAMINQAPTPTRLSPATPCASSRFTAGGERRSILRLTAFNRTHRLCNEEKT